MKHTYCKYCYKNGLKRKDLDNQKFNIDGTGFTSK